MKLTQRFLIFAAVAMIVVVVAFVLATKHTLGQWQTEQQSRAVASNQTASELLVEYFINAAKANAELYNRYQSPVMLSSKLSDIGIVFDNQGAILASSDSQITVSKDKLQNWINSKSINVSFGVSQIANTPALTTIQPLGNNQFYLYATFIDDAWYQQTKVHFTARFTDAIDVSGQGNLSNWRSFSFLIATAPKYLVFEDYLGNGYVELDFPPLLSPDAQDNSALYNYAFLLLAVIVAVLIGLLYALEKNFLKPIASLSHQVTSIKPEQGFVSAIDVDCKDEIGDLALSLNKMFKDLFSAKEFNRVILKSIGDAVITTDLDGDISFMNSSACYLLNKNLDEVRGLHVAEVLPFTEMEDANNLKTIMQEVLSAGTSTSLSRITHKINRGIDTLFIEKHITLLRDENEKIIGSVLVLRDMTQAERLRRKLDFQASYDAVTKLLNRHKYEEALQLAFAEAKQLGSTHVLCQIDLDRFKLINDSAGHAAGDQLLYEVGSVIKTQIRKTDVCARIGGDEFGIILHNVTVESSMLLFEKIVDQIKDYRFIWGGKIYSIGASLGVTQIVSTSQEIAEIRREADVACYMAKNAGQNNIRVFDISNESLNSHHQAPRWATRINDALVNDRFQLYFQPISATDVNSKERIHYEILLRMNDEKEGLLSPGLFLPAAERFRLTPKIDRWVIKNVFRWLSARPELWNSVTFSINLSGESLTDEDLIGYIISLHDRAGFPPQAICFEITETAAVSNLSTAAGLIEQLKEHGFVFALDDFGKGFSSYSYLQNLPAEYVKIDGGFVKEMTSNLRDKEIVRSIHEISNVMGMKTIAEFVESEEILEAVSSMGIHYAQGYGVGRPAELSTFSLPTPKPTQAGKDSLQELH
ncbi:hypothetical protein C2869_01695 [Saccharobesus litoralis]|uniref:Uncharacterized protein n=1 Tax=Saccharobesus litoralis TaxID=2172099 RepID=A0A2S0VM10_9ALTE|nr:EAL domain-containing protein [Saccharobesus litoralis]AWB65235.1 hypothetical protein C2869_01695 [Saccharobesus litoralis]